MKCLWTVMQLANRLGLCFHSYWNNRKYTFYCISTVA